MRLIHGDILHLKLPFPLSIFEKHQTIYVTKFLNNSLCISSPNQWYIAFERKTNPLIVKTGWFKKITKKLYDNHKWTRRTKFCYHFCMSKYLKVCYYPQQKERGKWRIEFLAQVYFSKGCTNGLLSIKFHQ